MEPCQLPPLETPCSACGGEGVLGYWGSCTSCHGSGRSLTEFGQKVLELVRRYFNFRPKNRINGER